MSHQSMRLLSPTLRPRARSLALVALFAGTGCREQARPQAPAPPPRKPRVEVTVHVDPGAVAEDDATVVLPAKPPVTRQLTTRAGMRIGISGLPRGLDPEAIVTHLDRALDPSEDGEVDAALVVSDACLEELFPVLKKDFTRWWRTPLVVGADCGAEVPSPLGVIALVRRGRGAKVGITFDRNTHAFLRVEVR